MQTGLAAMFVGAASAVPAQVPEGVPPATIADPDPVLVLPASGSVGTSERRTAQSVLPAGTPTGQVAREPTRPVETLREALARAYWTNPQLLAQRASLRGTDYRVIEARSAYGPQLSYSVSRGYVDARTDVASGATVPRSGWTTAARAVVDQPLFTFGRLRAGEDSARAQVDYGRGQLASLELQTMLQAIGAYVSVIRDRAAVGIAESQVDLLTREFNDTTIRLEKRDSTVADRAQVQSRLQVARAQLESQRGQQAASSATFLQVVGAPPGDLQAPNPLSVPAQTIEDAYLYAETHNPVIVAAYARERVSRAQLAGAQAELLPRIDLRGEAIHDPVTPYANGPRQNEMRATITLSGSLDAGGRLARVNEAREANDADWRLIDDALRQNRQEIASSWNAWKAESGAVDQLVVAVEAAERAYLGGLEQERAGLRTTTEVLDLARDLLTARSGLNTSRANVILAQARLLSAMGALDFGDLLPEESAYDPVGHFEEHDRDADIPLLTPAIRALDSLATQAPRDRSIRDPAASDAIGDAKRDGP